MSGIDQVIQTIHQVLSDPALQGAGTIIGIVSSGIAIFARKSSSPNQPRQRNIRFKKNLLEESYKIKIPHFFHTIFTIN